MSRIVSNASPLIVLAKASLLELLPKVFSEILIPQGVRLEIESGPINDPMRGALPGCSWLRVVILDPPLSPLATMQLGRGEAEVIEYARRQRDSDVLLDDRAGRRAAQALGLRALGTLSVVAIAARHGLVASFDVAVAQLRSAGLYASDAIVDAVKHGLRKQS